MTRTTALGIGILAAVALVVTGCSGMGGDDPTPGATTSPLDAYMSAIWESDADEAQTEADLDTFYGLIEQCMKDSGFTWTRPPEFTTTDDESAVDDPEWVAQWGYGQVTSPYIQWRAETDADNSDYLDTLSPSARLAYSDTLNGTAETYDLGTYAQGCWGASQAQVFGEDVLNQPENRDIMAEIEQMQTSRFDDPALAALDEEWSNCMADVGYDGFEAQGDAEDSIADALQAYWYSSAEFVDESPELDALHEKEVKLALADLDCREQVDYRDRAQPIQWAAEQQFIDDHQEELDALVASVEQARPAR